MPSFYDELLNSQEFNRPQAEFVITDDFARDLQAGCESIVDIINNPEKSPNVIVMLVRSGSLYSTALTTYVTARNLRMPPIIYAPIGTALVDQYPGVTENFPDDKNYKRRFATWLKYDSVRAQDIRESLSEQLIRKGFDPRSVDTPLIIDDRIVSGHTKFASREIVAEAFGLNYLPNFRALFGRANMVLGRIIMPSFPHIKDAAELTYLTQAATGYISYPDYVQRIRDVEDLLALETRVKEMVGIDPKRELLKTLADKLKTNDPIKKLLEMHNKLKHELGRAAMKR